MIVKIEWWPVSNLEMPLDNTVEFMITIHNNTQLNLKIKNYSKTLRREWE